MATVSLVNLSKSYPGEKGAALLGLKPLDLEMPDGELLVITGTGEGGGSILLRLISGLERPSSGDIMIDARRVNDLAPKDREIGMTFPNFALYPTLTVSENLAFGLKLRKYQHSEIERRVAEAVKILGIEKIVDSNPSALSTVERQSVALGRAIVRKPKVLLLDQPLLQLRPETRAVIRAKIVQLHERLQVTTICCVRDPIDAITLADRVMVMSDGVVQQDDSPMRVYERPANLAVARFFGTPAMNLVSGKLIRQANEIRFRETNGTIDVALPEHVAGPASEAARKEAILGIRPEDIELSPGSDTRRDGVFPALLDVVERMGAETHLHLDTGAHSLICRTRATIGRREAGHRMRFEINLKKVSLFDPLTGSRIG